MKWVLNIIQFLIVYLFAFYLIKEENVLGLDGIYANNTLITGISIGTAGALWKLYNRFSLFIIKNIKSTKLMHTFLFGYLSLKWRRLIRTIILLPYIFFLILSILNFLTDGFSNTFVDPLGFLVITVVYVFFNSLISWLVKPFAVDENKSKPILNTFFFGYLSKRWKRLARVLTWVFYPISIIIGVEVSDGEGGSIFAIIIYPILIILISYTLKPFLIRDSE